MNNPAPIGHNRDPFDEIKDEISDLYDEAKNWLDGEPINSQAIADNVEKLLAMIKDASKRCEAMRKEEVRPLDDQKSAIQDKYNALIGKTTKLTGKAVMAVEACQQALTPWKQHLQTLKDEEARKVREEAEAKRLEAQTAMQSANLEEREEAEKLVAESQRLETLAKRAAKDNVKGMRTEWVCEVTDFTALLKHYWTVRKADLEAFAERLAHQDIGAGKRNIPGCNIYSRKVAK